MTETAKKLLNQAKTLTAAERAALVQGLVKSLDKPDPSLDEQWLREAQDRTPPTGLGIWELSTLGRLSQALGR